jgi:hypothetical protein
MEHDLLDHRTRAFYLEALDLIARSGTPFLVGGAYALQHYTGIGRHTRDFDVFLRAGDASRLLERFAAQGYRTEMKFPHWLGKVHNNGDYVDLIFSSGNKLAGVDDEWFEHAVEGHVLDFPVLLVPPEEIIWSKGFIMERERFDGADILHLIQARGTTLDWERLLRRFGPHGRVLLSHLVMYRFVYPGDPNGPPEWVIDRLIEAMRNEPASGNSGRPVCRGTLVSRSQYLIDLRRGHHDARLDPPSGMTPEEIAIWTSEAESL